MPIEVGDKLILTEDIYDDGCENHHPPGYIGRKGDMVIVRKIGHGSKGGGERVYVSHETVTDSAFLVYRNEFTKAE